MTQMELLALHGAEVVANTERAAEYERNAVAALAITKQVSQTQDDAEQYVPARNGAENAMSNACGRLSEP